MSATAAMERPGQLSLEPAAGGAGDGEVGGEPTLEAVVSGAWEGLAAHAAVVCPVCGGRMEPGAGPGGRGARGRCARCSSELS